MPLYIVAFLVAACSIMAGAFGYGQGKEHTQNAWNIERAAQAEKLGLVMQAARAKETTAQVKVDAITKEKNAKLKALDVEYQRLAGELRNNRADRPEHPLPASAPDGNGARGCTGAALYREDAELVIAEARRADTIRLSLIQCQEAYEAVRKKFNAP